MSVRQQVRRRGGNEQSFWIADVQELLGHSTIEMTLRYAHLSPAIRRDAVTLLDQPHGNPTATTNA